jgi:multiple sugar transport system permease protein
VAAVIGEKRAGGAAARGGGLRRMARRKSTMAFFLALPLILLIGTLVVYPTSTRSTSRR